jgi:hypothetical protein
VVAVRQQSWFSLPDVNVIVPDGNYTALINLMKDLMSAMAYSVTVLLAAA